MDFNSSDIKKYLLKKLEKKSPLIAFCQPKIDFITEKACQIRLPLNDHTKSHLGSMGFGALAVGADLTGGLLAWFHIQKMPNNYDFCFAAAQIKFLKKPSSEVIFCCRDGDLISASLKSLQPKEKINITINVIATIESTLFEKKAAVFDLNLSIKNRGKV
ncbi:hypothetical protein [Legionella jamestowniensis]|uniref:Aromatic compounds catabolism n=1 Tax=Legionella jamestowniensis TaxID=455 RepID=A0A0W0UHL5_9GAMM|nr:hypothetical protein [Legionella jamestowniensis]KTD07379.1 aromatic compounds catabolism [Legionella jamestowniensis]SFL93830.1 Putative thioesterase (yiiD_Cterm) [Legionella jamestowniensis DSM 19215]